MSIDPRKSSAGLNNKAVTFQVTLIHMYEREVHIRTCHTRILYSSTAVDGGAGVRAFVLFSHYSNILLVLFRSNNQQFRVEEITHTETYIRGMVVWWHHTI